jgi:hypothetical protein
MFRLVTTRARRPESTQMDRIDREVSEALELFDERGWLTAPETYHETPPLPEGVREVERRSGNLRYRGISWLDGYEPRAEEPGAARFGDHRANRVARAALLEHRSSDRPWLLCVHGFGMGQPGLDLRAFRALHLHRALGLNVALLTLPFHGRRNPGSRTSSPPMPSVDVLDTVHGLAQAVWDVRQLLAHLATKTELPIGLMGLSLGGLVSGLVASLEAPAAVVLLVPAVDLPALMADAAGRGGAEVPPEFEVMRRAEPLFAPVSPLKLSPKVPVERRLIVAGTLDRFARPTSQAIALWRHWDRPALDWYHGGHVSLFWARNVQQRVDDHLRSSGLVSGAAGS